MNKVIILGRLTREPELRYLQSGSAVCSCGIAHTKKFKNQMGEAKEKTCFVDFGIFGKRAEVFNQYLKKGSKVLLEGELNLEQWEDQNGGKRSKHTINVSDFTMLDSKPQHAPIENQQNQNYAQPPVIDVDEDNMEIPF